MGAWNCDKNTKSRDAIVILDSNLEPVGNPWRGNLREYINEADSSSEFVHKLFKLCEATPPALMSITLAIDTPLGFSEDFISLVTGLKPVKIVGNSSTNPYLYRQTEHYLFEQGQRPLSAIIHMIGSQATKGMHVLAKFAPNVKSCGVWTGDKILTAIETYPTACKGSSTIKELQDKTPAYPHNDENDALTCALVAYLFSEKRELLNAPPESVSKREGWIWFTVV